MIKSFEDFQTLSKDGYEAFVASGTALTKGLQAIAQETTDFSRKSFEKGTQVVEKATATKSFERRFGSPAGLCQGSLRSLHR